jgi:hypothetical protein
VVTPNTAPMRARLARADPDAIVVHVDTGTGTRPLEYRSPEPVWRRAPRTLDFAAVALAQYAASRGTDLHLEGPVSAAQLERLDEYLQIWSVWRPGLYRRVGITADEETADSAGDDRAGAVMGYSGGVDASFALAAHATSSLGRLTRDVDLGVLVVGWDLRHGDEAAVRRARETAQRSLSAYGAGTAVVTTNWQQEFCASWFMSFTSGLAAVLQTFSESHSSAVHATDHSYRDELGLPPYGSSMVVNHLLGRPGFPLVSTGGTHRRTERLAFLADHPVLLDGLRVCFREGAGGGNCGHCQKCVRTQLELRVLGLPSEVAFPSPMTVEDLFAARTNNPAVLLHFEEILELMAFDDELRGPVRQWVRRQRQRRQRRQQVTAGLGAPRLRAERAG